MTVKKDLYRFLACNYALYLKTHNYHWNVEGAHFKPLHEMFQEQYEDLAGAIDDVAERIRMLGEKVPATFKKFDKESKIKDGNEKLKAEKMVAELAKEHEAMSKMALALVKVAQKVGDEGTADMMIQRSQVHDKAAWMLKMHLK